jgi:hypothetical protein
MFLGFALSSLHYESEDVRMVRNSGWRLGSMEYSFYGLMPSCIIWKNNLVTLIEKGLHFDMLHEKHAATTSNKPSHHLLKDKKI